MKRAALAAILSLAAYPAASDFLLQLPIDCALGDNCYVQQLPDRAPGPEAIDYTCGTLTYDGHKGTDFALPTLAEMHRGVAVLSAAPGVVAGTRDGMPDRYFTPPDLPAIEGRECGNGVVIRHEDGWETQYCHLRQGSITVERGERVDAGTMLGFVGLSGRSQFPHLHLSLRKDGAQVDPFAPDAHTDCGRPDHDLWAHTPPVTPGGLIYIGMSDHVPDYDAIKAGTAAQTTLPQTAPALVLFAFAFGSQPGDTLKLDLIGPKGPLARQTVTLAKQQAQFFRAVGRKRRDDRWAAGRYVGTATFWRGDTMLARQNMTAFVE